MTGSLYFLHLLSFWVGSFKGIAFVRPSKGNFLQELRCQKRMFSNFRSLWSLDLWSWVREPKNEKSSDNASNMTRFKNDMIFGRLLMGKDCFDEALPKRNGCFEAGVHFGLSGFQLRISNKNKI